MTLQTLVFNTKTKSVVVYEGEHHSKILYTFQDVPTVKVLDTYYEVMVKQASEEGEIRVKKGEMECTGVCMVVCE